MALTVLSHPLARHLVSQLRDVKTRPDQFRALCHRLTSLLVLEATAGLPVRAAEVLTPLEVTEAEYLDLPLTVVPVLRAGLGMLEPIVALFPDVSVGYIGLEREEATAVAHSYYCKLPSDLSSRFVLCVDPMLATGGSASQAISLIKARGGFRIVMVSIVAAPQGVERLRTDHPDVPIFTAALDRGLNERSYIVPGLGDFGDRLYGTP